MPPRAISDEQKQERQQNILDTAWTMFQETDYSTVTMAGIAERLGLAKGTIYLYFPTKEELFLAITMEQLAGWFREMDGRLDEIEAISPAQLAQTIMQSLAVRPDLVRLLAILSTVLEQNVRYEAAYTFKQRLGLHLTQTGERLEDRVASPGGGTVLPRGAGARFLLRLHALIVGLRHLSAPSPVVRQVLSAPEMQGYAVDFDAELSAIILALLQG
ncbi:MAG: TetR/AcrR family transcriptional regulator [Anaerolineales bacterium]